MLESWAMMTMDTAILYLAVCVSDIKNKAVMGGQSIKFDVSEIRHQPTPSLCHQHQKQGWHGWHKY